MDSSENDEGQETPTTSPSEPQAAREIDLSEEEGFPMVDPLTTPVNVPPALAEPGIYVCRMEIAGEHAVLGIMTQGQEYDYSHASDPRVLSAVAAYVECGVLEKKG